MDLFKSMKDLKVYCKELTDLHDGITVSDARIKIGKFKIVDTPSNEAAQRLSAKLRHVVDDESQVITGIYEKIETTLKEIQMDLFKNDEQKEEEPVKFGKKGK